MPALASRLAGTDTTSCVFDDERGVSVVAFHNTVLPLAKLLPVSVRLKAAEPAAAVLWLNAVSVGAAPMVKTALFDVTPFETTATLAEPALVSRLAGTVTVI